MDFNVEPRPLFVPDVDAPYEAVVVMPRVFRPAECDEIVSLGLELGAEESSVGARDREVGTVEATRRSRTAWISYSPDTDWIYDRLAEVARKANHTYGFDLSGFTEDIQFTAYDQLDDFFDWHQDGLVGEVAVRKLAMVVQLSRSADYAGADLELFSLEVDGMEPRQRSRLRARGTAVAFPAFEFHRVTPIKRGVRHSLVCWVGGSPLR